MALTTGNVRCVLVGEDYAFTQIRDTDGRDEFFFLWFLPDDVSAFERIRQSMWVSQLRDAIASGIQVTVGTPDESAALVDSIQLGVRSF